MKILVLSDLHLCGTSGKVDKFGWSDKDFISKIEEIRHKFDIIVLNGDIEDLYFYSEKEIRESHLDLYDYFDKNNSIFVKGNHDIDKNIRDSLCIDGVYFEHGDKGDFYRNFFLRTLFNYKDRFFDFIYMNVFKFLQPIYMKSFKKTKKMNFKNFTATLSNLDYANKLFFEDEYKRIITFGHTHVLQEVKSNINGINRVYLNSGTCSNGLFQGILIDTKTEEYTIINE